MFHPKNTPVRVTILCPAICISDAVNKARVQGKGVNYVISQVFLLFIHKEQADGNSCTFSTFSGKLAFLLRIPFKFCVRGSLCHWGDIV